MEKPKDEAPKKNFFKEKELIKIECGEQVLEIGGRLKCLLFID